MNLLTYYRTMPHFDALKIYSYGKHCEKRRNCLQFLLFSQCFLRYMALIFQFKRTLKCRLLFFSISDQSKNLSSGNGLIGKYISGSDYTECGV